MVIYICKKKTLKVTKNENACLSLQYIVNVKPDLLCVNELQSPNRIQSVILILKVSRVSSFSFQFMN